jgi:hypothetical protein
MNTQGISSVAIGNSAGKFNQGSGSIAIGFQTGLTNQGTNSIAIGSNAGLTNQAANCICIDATGNAVSQPSSQSCIIRPMRTATSSANSKFVLLHDASGEIFTTTTVTSNAGKSFVIDHPINSKKYLVHGCVEGPDTELIYRGKSEIIKDENISISIPEYATKIGFNWSIQLTPIGKSSTQQLSCSEVDTETGTFTVYCNNGAKFYWIVYGQRTIFEVEPDKDSIDVKGDGPYRWYSKKI